MGAVCRPKGVIYIKYRLAALANSGHFFLLWKEYFSKQHLTILHRCYLYCDFLDAVIAFDHLLPSNLRRLTGVRRSLSST